MAAMPPRYPTTKRSFAVSTKLAHCRAPKRTLLGHRVETYVDECSMT